MFTYPVGVYAAFHVTNGEALIAAAFIGVLGAIVAALIGAHRSHKLQQMLETPEDIPDVGPLMVEVLTRQISLEQRLEEHEARDDRVAAWAGVPAHVLVPPDE